MRLSDHLAEQQCKEIALLIVAGLRELHLKSINFCLLNPWVIKFDRQSALHLDMLWCVNKHLTKVNIDCVDSRYANYLGTL